MPIPGETTGSKGAGNRIPPSLRQPCCCCCWLCHSSVSWEACCHGCSTLSMPPPFTSPKCSPASPPPSLPAAAVVTPVEPDPSPLTFSDTGGRGSSRHWSLHQFSIARARGCSLLLSALPSSSASSCGARTAEHALLAFLCTAVGLVTEFIPAVGTAAVGGADCGGGWVVQQVDCHDLGVALSESACLVEDNSAHMEGTLQSGGTCEVTGYRNNRLLSQQLTASSLYGCDFQAGCKGGEVLDEGAGGRDR
eukprot:1156065-Pelagomonas_calceolata.AAC.3